MANTNYNEKFLKPFRFLGYTEGISFFVLLLIAMPLKYIWDKPESVQIVGMAHGVLFMLYVLAATLLAVKYKWSMTNLFLAYFAAVIPGGPFFFKIQNEEG